ncbi:MAG: RES domain-containing protein [Clostridia bacterium]|nr:RES domain-containing protein [Clostridia bacterium]
MVFCSDCFRNLEIKAIIEERGIEGDCSICGSKQAKIYDTDIDLTLIGIFDNLLSAYTAEDDLPSDYPKEELRTIVDAVRNEWDIFADISDVDVSNILKTLSPTILEDYPVIFEKKVGIPEKYDKEYLQSHSILRTEKWDDFVESIKHKNRFHTDLIDKDLLKKYCLDISKKIPITKQRFYRGRVAKNADGFPPSEMGAPPQEYASNGRANSAGISRLYLTDNKETTFHEIRAAEYDYVSVGTFKQLKEITVVDLKQIHKISPFGVDVDCTSLAINREHLLKINQEMSKPMRSGDSPLDYLPTQYICDFVMSITDEDGNTVFDGIEYQSAMHSRGSNFAIFNPENFKCTYSRTFEVTKLRYTKELLSKQK